MADTDIVQVIAEARVDARSLSEFVFKPADFMVTRRLAPSINTLSFYLNLFDTVAADGASQLAQAAINQGFITIDSFELGATITQRNEALRHAVDGKLYRWAGDMPKVVPASSTPTSSGGMGDNAWLEVSDVTLRQELANPNKGAALVGMHGEGTLQKWIDSNHGLTASQLGLVPGVDYTTLFNTTLKDRVLSDGITEIVLDTGDITVTGVLDFAYSSVVFGGAGKLLASDTRNIIQKTRTSKSDVKQFNGPINSGHVFCSAFKTAALIKKEVRVVLLGDSISVGGDYDSHDSILPGSSPTLGVDNKDRHTSFSSQLYAQIVAAVPSSTRVKFYNRSISGLGYGSIASAWDSIYGPFTGREQATAGKSWRDCVLDLKPDLVIHALGMNETPDSYANGFSDLWHTYLQGKQLLGTFDQAIVTTPNPNFQDATPYGDFRNYNNNATKFYTANLQRYFARLVGASLIDVSALSFIKRYGFDPRYCVFSNEEEHCVFSGTWGYSGEVAGTPRIIHIDNDSFYKTVRLRLNSSVDSSTTNYDFRIALGSVLVSIIPGFLRLYPKGPSSSNTLIGAPSTVKPFSLSAGVPKDIAITISPTGVFVYSGSNLVASSNKPVYSSTLGLKMELLNVTGVVTVDEVYLSNGLHPRYTADTKTHNEMYGFVDWTANKFGGGINHPSSVGITEVYTPPVVEWANSVINSTTEYSNILNGTAPNQIVQVGRVARVDGNEVSLDVGGHHLFKILVNSAKPDGFSVLSNPSGTGISILVDPDDLTVFFKNTTISVYTVNHTGAWLTKEVIKLGYASVRGGITPLPTK